MTTDILVTDIQRYATSLHRRMSLTRAATMCGVSVGTVKAWSDGRVLTDRMLRSVAIAMVCSREGWVGVFGTVRPPMGVRVIAVKDSSSETVRVTITNTNNGR